MPIDVLFNVVENISKLVEVLTFLVTGLSFGYIHIKGILNGEFVQNRAKFVIRVIQGYVELSFLFYCSQCFVAMYYGYSDYFEFLVSIVGVAVCTAIFVFIQQNDNDKYLKIGLLLLGSVLIIKMCHTVYFNTNMTKQGIRDDTYNYFMLCMIFELILLLFASLIPYIYIQEKEGHFHLFTVWGLEFADLVNQIAVIQTYARMQSQTSNGNEVILIIYYSLFVADLIIFILGIHAMFAASDFLKKYIAAHIIIIDVLSDIPFFITSLIGRSYIGNIYIAVDMVFKMAVFVRGVIWTPCKIDDDVKFIEINPKETNDYDEPTVHQRSKRRKIITIIICFMVVSGIIVALYFYLGWTAKQYENSLTLDPTMEPSTVTYSPTTYPSILPTTSSPTAKPTFNNLHITLQVENHGCSQQDKNLQSDFASPIQCAQVANTDIACTGTQIMWSDSYTSWGCRCCSASSQTGDYNQYWDIYLMTNAAHSYITLPLIMLILFFVVAI